MDTAVRSKTVCYYQNNKPWVTSDLKALTNEEERAFKVGDKGEVKCMQWELKVKIRESNEAYRRKLEGNL